MRGLLVRAGGMAALAGAILGAGYVWYYRPASVALRARLSENRDEIDRYEAELRRHPLVRRELEQIAQTTLGREIDQTEHRFRTELDRIARECGLSGLQVASSAVQARVSPLPGVLRNTREKQAFKNLVDFEVMEGTVTGQGSLADVLRASAAIRAQPWVHRVTVLDVAPANQGRTAFSLRLQVETLLMRDVTGGAWTGPEGVEVASLSTSEWSPIVSKNVFVRPAEVVTAPPQRDPQPPPPPPPPRPPAYDSWRLTGLWEGRHGVEAALVNDKSGEMISLAVGAGVSGATFVGGAGEMAVFEIEGERYVVQSGQTLAERTRERRSGHAGESDAGLRADGAGWSSALDDQRWR